MRTAPAQAPAPRRGTRGVPRDRLLERLAAARDATVVIVTGPPGAGKSTLAAQWDLRDPRPHAILRLAAHHDEASALATALIDTAEQIGPPEPELRALVTGAEPRFSSVLLPGLARLAASRAQPYVLVLDDTHALTTAGSQRVLAAFCTAVPPGSSVLLLSRSAPPPWTARLRAQGRVIELTAADLAFDVAEGSQLLRDLGLRLDADEVATLVGATEGWAVALYLGGLALAHGRPSAAPPDGAEGNAGARVAGADRFIVDYLRAEVLGALDDEAVGVCLRTAVLPDLEPGACDAVRQASDSARLLPALADRLQLIIPLDREGSRFRYHHLFAEALQAELVARWPEEVPDLHHRAALWYADSGDLDEGIRQAKAAGDLDLVAELIWRDIVRSIAADRPDRLRRWLEGLTERQVAANQWLSLATAWSCLQGADIARMDRWILQCEAHAGPDWRARAAADHYAAELASLMMIVGRDGLADSQHLALSALVGLPRNSPIRAAAAFIGGVALTLRRELIRGEELLLEAGRLAQALEVPIIEADTYAWRGLLAILAGDTDRGTTLVLQGVGLVRQHHLERLATAAHCITAQALALALRGDRTAPATLATARRLTLEVSDIAPWFNVCGRLIQARTAALLGDGSTARLLVREARHYLTPELEATLAMDLLDDTEQAIQRLAETTAPGVSLTSAELRVLQFMPSHLSFPEIGEHMFLSRNTVKTHALSIYRKLGVTSRSEAVAVAYRLGLVDAGGIE